LLQNPSILSKLYSDNLLEKQLKEQKMDSQITFRDSKPIHPTHGILDVFLGFFVVLAGAGLLVDLPWLGAILVPGFIPIYQSVRQRLVPVGNDSFSSRQPMQPQHSASLAKLTWMMLGFLFLGIVFMLIFLLDDLVPGVINFIRGYFLLIMGGISALMLAVAALITHQTRLWWYALLCLLWFAFGHWIGFHPGWGMVGIGICICLTGLFLLVRFLSTREI
jgi:hypothetical protein